jgi:glycosyltransferase involved in cell wall biosynthesis
LQRLGVETIHTPFYPDITTFLRDRGSEFDLAYITRYGAARQVLGQLADFAPQARTVINVADLHFLRQIRDAMVAKDSTSLDMAMETRDTEISVLSGAELVLSYSAIEQAVITSHIAKGPKTGLLPWVIDPRPLKAPFGKRRDIAFLGGFSHTPNIAAVRFFADEVMPLLRVALPGIRFLVYGSAVPPEVEALASDDVIIKGYVKDVSEVFDSCRVFVAPLLSGAGMKGKVLDCIAAGIPSVLSPIAAEGIGLRDGFDTIIAVKPEEWVQGIMKLYNGEAAWNTMSKHLLELAANRFSFETGVANLREALAAIEFYLPGNAPALHATSARPIPPRYLPESVMGGKIVSALPSGRQQ